MICYKDKTFCSSDCVNTSCHRHKSHYKVQPRGQELPVALADFSADCAEYKPPKQERTMYETCTLADVIID